MSDPIDPTRGVSPEKRLKERRARDRRAKDRRAAAGQAGAKTNLPVPVAQPKRQSPPTEGADAAFAAQLLGQPGQKRGLKGGPPVLEQARSTYLETNYSGPADRRLRAGRITKTEA